MPDGYAEERNLVFPKVELMAASLGHENVNYREGGQAVIGLSILCALVLALFNLNLERPDERS